MTEAATVPKSTPGHGGKRPGAGRPPGSGRKPKVEQNDAYTLLAKAKAKRETYRAQMAELEYRQKNGELVPADEVAAAWTEQVMIAKGRLLNLPARLAPDLVNATDMRQIEQTIRAAVVEVLEELSGGG
jgi:BMFP domain-containing protein YqiC